MRQRTNLEQCNPNPPLLDRFNPQDHLSPQGRPLLNRLGPQPLLNRLSPPKSEARALQSRLGHRGRAQDHPTKLLKPGGPPRTKSLLERMSVAPPSRSSSPLLPSFETVGSLKRRLSQESSQSWSTLQSPKPKRTKLSNSIPRNSIPSDMETNPLSLLERMEGARSLISPDDTIAPRSPTTPSTDHTQEIQTIPIVPRRNGNSPRSTSPGTNPTIVRSSPCQLVASRPVNAWEVTSRTSQDAETRSRLPPEPRGTSPSLSGSEFSEAKPSTWTTSSPLSTALQLMRRERLALEMRESALASLTRNGVSVPLQSGPQLGALLPKPPHSPFPTARRNSAHTATTSTKYSRPSSQPLIPASSCSTSPCETWSKEVNPASLPTTTPSRACIPPSSCQTERNPPPGRALIADRTSPPAPAGAKRIFATGSTLPSDVPPQTPTASTATCARIAENTATVRT
jgi:hypothetical protein